MAEGLTLAEREAFEQLFRADYDDRERRALCRAALARLEAALAEPPHWVDELVGRWVAWSMQRSSMASDVHDPELSSLHEGASETFRRCARELRERAKENA